jgi:hypothetical protein
MVKDQHPQAVKEATASVLVVWLEAFKVLLDLDPRQDVKEGEAWDGLIVRREVFRVGAAVFQTLSALQDVDPSRVDSGHDPHLVPARIDALPPSFPFSGAQSPSTSVPYIRRLSSFGICSPTRI